MNTSDDLCQRVFPKDRCIDFGDDWCRCQPTGNRCQVAKGPIAGGAWLGVADLWVL